MPSRTARAIASSDQLPAPVSRSGVMFGTISHGTLVSTHRCPAPSAPGLGTQSSFARLSEWQARHGVTPFHRYAPRASRAGVASKVLLLSGRAREPTIGRHPIVAV